MYEPYVLLAGSHAVLRLIYIFIYLHSQLELANAAFGVFKVGFDHSKHDYMGENPSRLKDYTSV